MDEAAAVDGNIITARKPDDVGAFTTALIGLLGNGRQSAAPERADALQS